MCHDALGSLGAGSIGAGCPGCATQLHPECRALLRGPCPTRGCRAGQARGTSLRARDPVAALVVLAWILCGLAGWAWPTAVSQVARFDRILALTVWIVAGPLCGIVALDRDERRTA